MIRFMIIKDISITQPFLFTLQKEHSYWPSLNGFPQTGLTPAAEFEFPQSNWLFFRWKAIGIEANLCESKQSDGWNSRWWGIQAPNQRAITSLRKKKMCQEFVPYWPHLKMLDSELALLRYRTSESLQPSPILIMRWTNKLTCQNGHHHLPQNTETFHFKYLRKLLDEIIESTEIFSYSTFWHRHPPGSTACCKTDGP